MNLLGKLNIITLSNYSPNSFLPIHIMVSVLSNITEAEVYVEQIFKVESFDAKGEKVVESEVVFHAIKESTQVILTNDEVLRYTKRYIIKANHNL